MEERESIELMTTQQDNRISEAVEDQRARLRNFIRRRVADEADAEDILQDVFYEFVQAYRLMRPIEQAAVAENSESPGIEDLLPSADAGPEAAFARTMLLAELDDAIDELPEEQREVFIAHELEGRSFKELAAE